MSNKPCEIFSCSDLANTSTVEEPFDLSVCDPSHVSSQDWHSGPASKSGTTAAPVGDTPPVDRATGLAFYERIAASVEADQPLKSSKPDLP